MLNWNTPLLLMSTHTIKVSLLLSLLNRQRVGEITSCSDATNSETLAIEATIQSCSMVQRKPEERYQPHLVADIRLADISIALFTPTPSSHPLPSSPVPEGPGIRPLMLALSSQPNSHTQQASKQ
jgi:hypothetical protein